jgi:hypothetical protein
MCLGIGSFFGLFHCVHELSRSCAMENLTIATMENLGDCRPAREKTGTRRSPRSSRELPPRLRLTELVATSMVTSSDRYCATNPKK